MDTEAPMDTEAGNMLRAAADRLEVLAGRTTGGTWEITGLLATRPEVIARDRDGATQHVAEARAATAAWIAAMSPEIAAPLAAWLRAAAAAPASPEARAVAEVLSRHRPHGNRAVS